VRVQLAAVGSARLTPRVLPRAQTQLTKSICLSTDTSKIGGPDADADGAEALLSQFLPPFLWLLRDFHLDLEKDGEAISVAQYLEQALEDRPGASSRVKENNRIRQSFKALFPDRQCATLVRPAVRRRSSSLSPHPCL
jgi:hypothetical protein